MFNCHCKPWLRKKLRSPRFLFLSGLTILTFFFIRSQCQNQEEFKSNVFKLTVTKRYNFKYILLWQKDYPPFDKFETGQRELLRKYCPATKCFIVKNRNYFVGALTQFDAIVFHGRNMSPYDLPPDRASYQKYIFFNLEYYPVCVNEFEGFFNWTLTHRLDSDIPHPYITVWDTEGTKVGPKRNMEWNKDMIDVSDEFSDSIKYKTKAAAVFMSYCETSSIKHVYVEELKDVLEPYGLTIDVFGDCGDSVCFNGTKTKCTDLLKRDYFFYLAIEESFTEDFVTENLLMALQNDVVPVVYGATQYSSFLPPGSYIKVPDQNASGLAALMDELIKSPHIYKMYFKWKQYYRYTSNPTHSMCSLCEALHNENKFEETTINNNFLYWWNSHSNTELGCTNADSIPE